MTPAKLKLLDEIAAALTEVPNVVAVALGGSQARGTATPDSDIDLGLYYREAAPFPIADISAIAQRFSQNGEPTVTGFYEWGPFVNGGAWIQNPVSKVDFLYRNLDQLERTIQAAEQGEWDHSFDQQPPFGFRSVTTLGEIHICKPLYDPNGVLPVLKNAVAVFPPKLKARIVKDTLWCAEFSFSAARKFAKTGDVPNTVACMTRIFHYLAHALFALNEVYFVNDKHALQEIDGFALKPAAFGRRVGAVFAAPGKTVEALKVSIDALDDLFVETVALTQGRYRPRFNLA